MFRSATFRLTLYYTAIIALISIAFSAALYQVAERDLSSGLARQNNRILEHFPVFNGSPYLQTRASDLSDDQQDLLARLIALNILVIALGGLAGYALARHTLVPIEDAHERQKRFVGDVSHELRTPLAALKMDSEVALMDPAADLRETVQGNIDEAGKLTDLVNNLLRLSQLDTADAVTLAPVTLADPVASAVDRVRPLADARRITLTVTGTRKVQAISESQLLEQLLVILLDNAVKYSPNGAEVTLAAHAQQGTVQLSVIDRGAGIAKADLEHVFDRFYRADTARTASAQNGYGIGLAIAQSIATRLDATLQLTSQVGKGTTATVTLQAAER